MNKTEYLNWLKERLDNKEITEECYEHGVANADIFSEEDK